MWSTADKRAAVRGGDAVGTCSLSLSKPSIPLSHLVALQGWSKESREKELGELFWDATILQQDHGALWTWFLFKVDFLPFEYFWGFSDTISLSQQEFLTCSFFYLGKRVSTPTGCWSLSCRQYFLRDTPLASFCWVSCTPLDGILGGTETTLLWFFSLEKIHSIRNAHESCAPTNSECRMIPEVQEIGLWSIITAAEHSVTHPVDF